MVPADNATKIDLYEVREGFVFVHTKEGNSGTPNHQRKPHGGGWLHSATNRSMDETVTRNQLDEMTLTTTGQKNKLLPHRPVNGRFRRGSELLLLCVSFRF
jgi:hypothetical protein